MAQSVVRRENKTKRWLGYFTCLLLGACLGAFALYTYYKGGGIFRKQAVYASKDDGTLLAPVFDRPLVTGEALLQAPALQQAMFYQQLLNATVMDTFQLENVYDAVVVHEVKTVKPELLQLSYSIGDYESTASFYTKPGNNDSQAVLYIPSTYDNSGYNTYHGLNKVENPFVNASLLGNFFVLEKPGDGALAIHDGIHKFNLGKVLPYIINLGRSYSVKYLLDAMAVGKYLKTKYGTLHLWGYSQGGHAAILLSMFIKPATAVVASGYSVLFDRFYWMDGNQITGTNALRYVKPDYLLSNLADSSTKVLLTYGLAEKGIYGMEGRDHITEKAFKSSSSFVIKYHFEGHVWPVNLVNRFYQLSN